MLSRRSILTGIGITTAVPALLATPQETPQETPDRKKYIIVVVDRARVSRNVEDSLGKHLRQDGFQGAIISVAHAPDPIKVIDLSNLPKADFEEVRRLCEEAQLSEQ